MKAYYLSIAGDDDARGAVVFADTTSKAKAKIHSTTLADSWSGEYVYLRACRYKQFDGMENLSAAELALEQWHSGWRWFDMEYPDPDEATDAEFYKWYEDNFGKES